MAERAEPNPPCIDCGRPAREPRAQYCERCFTRHRADSRDLENRINRARNAATRRLKRKFSAEWTRIYAAEKRKLGI